MRIACTLLVLALGTSWYPAEAKSPRHVVFPCYPTAAHSAGIEGEVKLQVRSDRHGNVVSVVPIAGEKEFVESAIEAVNSWRYSGSWKWVLVIKFELVSMNEWRKRKGANEYDLPGTLRIFEPKIELPSSDK